MQEPLAPLVPWFFRTCTGIAAGPRLAFLGSEFPLYVYRPAHTRWACLHESFLKVRGTCLPHTGAFYTRVFTPV